MHMHMYMYMYMCMFILWSLRSASTPPRAQQFALASSRAASESPLARLCSLSRDSGGVHVPGAQLTLLRRLLPESGKPSGRTPFAVGVASSGVSRSPKTEPGR